MDIINWLKSLLQSSLQWVVDMLPNSPFQVLDNTVIKPYLPYVNWFIPFDFMLSTMETWLAAVAAYYLYSVILRIVKAVQ